MDVKVYQKEEVKQPEGIIEVFKPSIIDMIPIETVTREGTTIVNFEVLEDGSKELLEQTKALIDSSYKAFKKASNDYGDIQY